MTGRRRSSATELKIADALAQRHAWDESSEVTETDLWALVQPRLPRGDAGRAYAERAGKKAASDTESERIAKGQRMFFDDALKAMIKAGQVQQNIDSIYLGAEPLWRAAGENAPLEIYTPGWHGLKDAEARRRAEDRKMLDRILNRKAFEISSDSDNYKALLLSMRRYGYHKSYPIVIDDSTEPPFVLDGRTRLAVARELGIEQEVLAAAHRVKADSTFALEELVRGNLARRQLSSSDVRAVRELLEQSNSGLEEVQRIEAAVRENEDRLQRRQGEKRERIQQALLEWPQLSHNAISKRLGVGQPVVKDVCDKLLGNSIILNCGHQFTEDGKQAPGPKPKTRPVPKYQDPAMLAEIRACLAAGQSPRQDDMAKKYGYSSETVNKAVAIERALRDAGHSGDPGGAPGAPDPAATSADPDLMPEPTSAAQTAPSSASSRPSNRRQNGGGRARIAALFRELSQLWTSQDPDGDTELEQLRQARELLDERIKELENR